MSATVAAERAQPPPQPRRGLARRVVPLTLVLVLAAGAAAWFLLLAPEAEPDGPRAEGVIVTLEPLTTTLGEAGLQHARVALAVVLVEGADPALVEDRQALLKDALLQQVAHMGADELRGAPGSAALRTRLTDAALGIWGEEVVARVVLTELLVQ